MNQIDFLPAHYVQAQQRRSRLARQAAMLAVVACCMIGWHWSNGRRLAELEMLAKIAQDHAQATQSQLQELAKFEQRRQTILRQTQVQRDLSLPIGVTPAVAVLANLMPPSMATTRLSVVSVRPTPTPKPLAAAAGHAAPAPLAEPAPEALAPMRIELTGLAPDDMAVADFVGKVSAHPLFANVKMTYSRATQAQGLKGREFRVEMEVPLDREYRPAKPSTASTASTASAGEVAHAD